MATATQTEPAKTAGSFELHGLRDNQQAAIQNVDQEEPPAERGLTRDQMLKLIAAGFSFFVSGFSDGSMGALVPYVIRDYGLTTAIVSIVYVSPSPHSCSSFLIA